MYGTDLLQAEDDLIKENAAHILHDTGLTVDDLRQNQPVLDIGAGFGFLGRFGKKHDINVTSLEPQEVHFGEQIIYQLAVRRLLERKALHEKPYFVDIVRRHQKSYPLEEAIAIALNNHGINVEREEVKRWGDRIQQPDTLQYVRDDIQDSRNIDSQSFGLAVSRRAPPLHPLSTIDIAKNTAREITRVLKRNASIHIGPGPINASLDVNGEFTQRSLNNPARCVQETEALLREIFVECDVTAHALQEPNSQYYVATKQ